MTAMTLTFHISDAFFFFKSRPPYQVEKKKNMGVPEVGVLEEGVYCKMVFL